MHAVRVPGGGEGGLRETAALCLLGNCVIVDMPGAGMRLRIRMCLRVRALAFGRRQGGPALGV